MVDQEITVEEKIDALLEDMLEKTDKSREELIWIGVQLLWNRRDKYLGDAGKRNLTDILDSQSKSEV